MQANSFTISNRDEDLPPLLLPSLNLNKSAIGINTSVGNNNNNNNNGSTSDNNSSTGTDIQLDPFLPTLTASKRSLTDQKLSNGLHNLASLATKRPKLSTSISDLSLIRNTLNSITPPPTLPVSTSISPSLSTESSSSSMRFEDTFSLSKKSFNDSVTPRSITPISNKNNIAKINSVSILNTRNGSNTSPDSINCSNNNKRQRVGPSCDKCRLKKIKCDATIDVLAHADNIISLVTNNLHYALTKEDVIKHRTELRELNVPEDVLQTFLNQSFDNSMASNRENFINVISIIKHIDKLVLFKPCLSCCKKKHSSIITTFGQTNPFVEFLNCCTFSKGFTRADIKIFSNIARKVKDKSIYEMDVTDYKNAGF